MKDPNDLHKLVRSLTKSEKRYFKLYCSTEKGTKNYMLLFDELDKQKEYDEEKLKKKFKGKSFLRQFSVLKHELYNKILFILTIVHSDKTVFSRIRWLNQETDILRRKKLLGQALKRVSKAKALCEEYELYELMPDAYMLEQSCNNEMKVMLDEKDLDKWYSDLYSSIDKMKNFFEYYYWLEYLHMHVLYPSKPDNDHVDAVFGKIMDSPLFKNKERALIPFTQSLYHYMHMTHGSYTAEWEKCYEHAKGRVEVFDTNSHFKSTRPNGYASALANYFLGCKNTARWREAIEPLDRLKTLPAAGHDPVVRSYIYGCELSLYSFSDPRKVPPVLIALDSELNDLLSRIDKYNTTLLLYSKAYAHFVIGDHRNALRTIVQVKGNSLSFKEDIQLYIRILELMVHYEKENDDIMQPLVNSLYRFIRRRASLTQFETELLDFFIKSYKKKEPFDMKAFYQRLQEIAASDKRSLRVLEYIDIMSWVKSKAEKQPMAETIGYGINTAGY
jgi:hypothetical protein